MRKITSLMAVFVTLIDADKVVLVNPSVMTKLQATGPILLAEIVRALVQLDAANVNEFFRGIVHAATNSPIKSPTENRNTEFIISPKSAERVLKGKRGQSVRCYSFICSSGGKWRPETQLDAGGAFPPFNLQAGMRKAEM